MQVDSLPTPFHFTKWVQLAERPEEEERIGNPYNILFDHLTVLLLKFSDSGSLQGGILIGFPLYCRVYQYFACWASKY